MKVAARFKPCHHLGCFDLHVFLEMSQQTRKWQCPQCRKNYSLDDIVIDPYFNRIAAKMSECEEDIVEVEIKRDGSWRAKVEEFGGRIPGDLVSWHYPDGTPWDCEIQPLTSAAASNHATDHGPIVKEDLNPTSEVSEVIIIDSDSEDEKKGPTRVCLDEE